MTDLTVNSTSGPDSMYSMVAVPYVIFAILAFIISTTLMILIFSYLNNVSLVEECFLVYLYKDVVIMLLLSNSIRLITVIVLYSSPSGLGISPTTAKVISFVPALLAILLLLFINTINVVKCYILKSKVLDPPMPWGDDDALGINIIRLAYSIFTVGFFSVMYVFGPHPKIPLYYVLVERHPTNAHFPEYNYILAGLCIALCITSTITGVVAKVYEEANKQLLEAIIAQQINYSLVIFPTILVMLILLTFYLVKVFEVFYFMNLLEIIYVVISLLYILVPAFIFYRVHPVRSHAVKFLKNKWEDAFFLKIYVTPVLITVIMYPSLFILYQLIGI